MDKPLIEWTDALSIGIEEVDQQHKALVAMLNDLNTAIHEHHGSAEARKILDRLAEYTRVHFATEEGVMRLIRYPGFDIHKNQHEHLLGEVVSLQEKLDKKQASISFELLHFLKVWLSKHITESDKRFGEFAVSRGLVAAAASWAPVPVAAPAKSKPWWKFW
jgi:hemerythrin